MYLYVKQQMHHVVDFFLEYLVLFDTKYKIALFPYTTGLFSQNIAINSYIYTCCQKDFEPVVFFETLKICSI